MTIHVWRLTLEPVGNDVAWSLLLNNGTGTSAVDAGIIRDTRNEEHAAMDIPPLAGKSALLDPDHERGLATLLGRRLLPPMLREALEAGTHTLYVATRGWLANLPWEALVIDSDNRRLIEAAVLVGAMSPGIIATRVRTAAPFTPTGAGLAIVDAGPPRNTARQDYSIYPGGLPVGLVTDLAADAVAPGDYSMSAEMAGEALTGTPWSRLLYLGHIAAGHQDEPAATALVFQRRGEADKLTAAKWLAEPQTWPAPARVALIGCGSDDARFMEASGLPVAAVNAGAHLVTCTRWALPADAPADASGPTTGLARAVLHAHRSAKPVHALRAWQVQQLCTWKKRPTPEVSPFFWASLATYLAPETNP
ncbi:CHAT domain-containing protein [Kribbella antibiotica]|uniref:CHAT domain-containing protein n=1 Tax=Kribbella antibiotica TaxID=190195 RepID=A0A4R4ZP44_9ACTN|nr:CHAT domain-containing protein [Kribbella antibiotica]TDD60678.1 CHAT domain-containing protein [Kribbella antibiotica]